MLLLWFLEKKKRSPKAAVRTDDANIHVCCFRPLQTVTLPRLFLFLKCFCGSRDAKPCVVCCHEDKENSSATSRIWSQTGTEHVFLKQEMTSPADGELTETQANHRGTSDEVSKRNIRREDMPTRHRWSTLTTEGFKNCSNPPWGLDDLRPWSGPGPWGVSVTSWKRHQKGLILSIRIDLWTFSFAITMQHLLCFLFYLGGGLFSFFTSPFLHRHILTCFTCVCLLCCSVFLPLLFLSNFVF